MKSDFLNRNNDHNEDFYAARIGRIMWQVAKRRASETHQRQTRGLPIATENIVAWPMQHLDPTMNRESGQNTLAKFLRALAEELAEDD